LLFVEIRISRASPNAALPAELSNTVSVFYSASMLLTESDSYLQDGSWNQNHPPISIACPFELIELLVLRRLAGFSSTSE